MNATLVRTTTLKGPEAWAWSEFGNTPLRDRRRRQSLARICAALVQQPELSFSAACGPALRQAATRLFRHPETTVQHLLAGHFQQTAARCRAYPLVLAVQDTTSLDYHRHAATTGLGPTNDQPHGRGLLAHTVYAVAPDGTPLGLLHAQFWARDPAARGQAQVRRTRLPAEKESHKWRQGLVGVEAALPSEQPVLLVQDREGDVFDFLAAPRRAQTHLLVRAAQPRKVSLPASAQSGDPAAALGLFQAASTCPQMGTLRVTIGRRQEQAEREAVLTVRCGRLQIQAPRRKGVSSPPQTLWVVLATETAPPAGVTPVEWVLLTTMPVETEAMAEAVVGYYARRWLIERLHYTLKSGFQVERLQMDAVQPLQHALAVYYVAAWRLMYLTHLARTEPEQAASTVLAPVELQVLTQATGKPVATLRQAVRVIAQLGGYEEYRGGPEPGVKVLWRGYRRLQDLVDGWDLALAALQATRAEI